MGSLSKMAAERGKTIQSQLRSGAIRIESIHLSKLNDSKMNFYSQKDIESIADSILIVGILQPLIVRKTDISEYEILAGHKRRKSLQYNVDRGYEQCNFAPCVVLDMSELATRELAKEIFNASVDSEELYELLAEYIVIASNKLARQGSNDYERMMEAVRLNDILPRMIANEGIRGRALRSLVAEKMDIGDGQVARYMNIHNNCAPEVISALQREEIGVSACNELASLPQEAQKELLDKNASYSDILDYKQALKTEESTENTSDETESEEETSVSESDTKEESIQEEQKVYREYSLDDVLNEIYTNERYISQCANSGSKIHSKKFVMLRDALKLLYNEMLKENGMVMPKK